MKEIARTIEDFQIENEILRARLAEAEAVIQAIRSGEVDAVVVNGPTGEKIYTLSGADRTYRILVDAMSEGALVLSLEGIITYCNRSFVKMLDLPIGSVLGHTIYSFVAEADVILLKSLLEQYPTGNLRQEFSLRRNDSLTVPALFSIGKLENDDKQSISVIVTDLTERKLAEIKLESYRRHLEQLVVERTKDLANSQMKYQALVESTNDFIWEVDTFASYTYCSPQSESLWGYKPEEMIGKVIFDFLPPESREAGIKAFMTLKENPGPFRGETTSFNSKGQKVSLESSGVPFCDKNGELQGFRGITRDITERKNAELALKKYTADLEAANKELESFSYSVSHDLRAPLRALIGFSQILIDDYKQTIDEEGQDYLNRIWKASQTMSQLIDDMLRLSGIIRAEMQIEQVDISEMVNRITADMAQSQPDRKVEFLIASGISAAGDPALLQICLRNLLENAWKFTSKNSEAVIEFGVGSTDEGVVYFIKDNGIGFDMKYSDKLFQPFQRLHLSYEYQGTGIGLAIVQRIIRRHGGRIWTESAIGKGTTFFFTINPDDAKKHANYTTS
jgi:PAS domain S-box-containing protein